MYFFNQFHFISYIRPPVEFEFYWIYKLSAMLNEKINVIDRQKLNYYDLDENVCLFLSTDYLKKEEE